LQTATDEVRIVLRKHLKDRFTVVGVGPTTGTGVGLCGLLGRAAEKMEENQL
jgi:hypothetical protein